MHDTITVADLLPAELSLSERSALSGRARHVVSYGVHGAGVSARFDDASGARELARRYGALRRDEPAALPVYAVRDDAGRPHFWTDGGPAYQWPHGPLSGRVTAFFADAFATHALLSSLPAAVSLHAAALRWNDVAFALTGISTAGKSTTALACAAAGARLYSDERCVVTTEQGTIPFPRTINVRQGGLDLLLDTLPDCDLRRRLAPHRGGDWEGVRFDELFGAAPLPAPAPLRALFAIAGRDAEPRSRRIAPVEMLPLAEQGANVRARGIDRVCALLEFFRGVACFELVLGSPTDSARHVLARVDELSAA
jgi:hypothetical protein